MKLVELLPQDKGDYNRFVQDCASGSFLQSWEWGDWQASLGRQVFRFLVLGDSENKIASIQLIKTPLPLGKYYLYAPYGPVGAENYEFGIKNLELLSNKFPDAVFIRIEPKSSALLTTHYSLLTKSSNIQPAKTLLINLTKPEDQLLAEMHHKTRYNIRLAQKHGVEIKDEFDISIGHGLFAKEAVDLIVETGKRQGYKGHSAEYYEKMIDCLGLQNQASELRLHIYKAVFQNQLLACSVIIDFSSTRTYLFGGSSDTYKNLMAPYLLHWQAMVDAKNLGFLHYDFWGIETSSGKEAGFARFKLGFAPQTDSDSFVGVKEYGGAYDLVISKAGYRIYQALKFVRKLLKK